MLSKVIGEPNLLKLEAEKIKVSGCKEQEAEKQPVKQTTGKVRLTTFHQERETESAMVYSKENTSNVDCMKGQKEVNVKSDNDDANKMAENCENQLTCVFDGNQLKRTVPRKFKRRRRSDFSDPALPPSNC